tara:strand:- start:203 stop:547 length:345 start_codon:yes stop_codon:yes gene_type:complete
MPARNAPQKLKQNGEQFMADMHVTPMQLRVLRFVAAWWLVEKDAPRIRDVAWHLNKSLSSANDHIQNLIMREMLHRIPGKKRGLTVTEKGHKVIEQTTKEQLKRKRKRKKNVNA